MHFRSFCTSHLGEAFAALQTSSAGWITEVVGMWSQPSESVKSLRKFVNVEIECEHQQFPGSLKCEIEWIKALYTAKQGWVAGLHVAEKLLTM